MNTNQMPELDQEQKEMLARIVDNTENMKCQCGCEIFAQGRNMKRISRIITGASHDDFLQFPVFYCVKCHQTLVLNDNPEPDNIIKLK